MTLEEIKQLVGKKNYTYSYKVLGYIQEGWYTHEDLECCVMGAEKFYKKEKDELAEAVGGKKYVIIGKDTHGNPFYTAGKVMSSAGGQSYFFITAHEANEPSSED